MIIGTLCQLDQITSDMKSDKYSGNCLSITEVTDLQIADIVKGHKSSFNSQFPILPSNILILPIEAQNALVETVRAIQSWHVLTY